MTEAEIRAALSTAHTNTSDRYRWPMTLDQIDHAIYLLRAAGLLDRPSFAGITREEAEGIIEAWRLDSGRFRLLDLFTAAGAFRPPALPDGRYEVAIASIGDGFPYTTMLYRRNGEWCGVANGGAFSDQSAVRPLARLTETPL